MKTKYEYDMHIATEAGDSVSIKKALEKLGFMDDNLADRRLMFDPETEKHYTTCPAIVVHASKKVENHPELRELEIEVDKIMQETNSTGYWHSECILGDKRIESKSSFALKPLPFARLLSRPRNKEKVWDIHLAIRESLIPKGFSDVLIRNGVYYLARWKKVPEGGQERFAVFTAQGVNSLKEGRRFYVELCEWLEAVGAPPCDIKLELTTAMRLYNSPRAVPPTVDRIEWVKPGTWLTNK
jgi:hypothetical protein